MFLNYSADDNDIPDESHFSFRISPHKLRHSLAVNKTLVTYKNLVFDLAYHESPIAHWLQRPTGIWKVMGSTPVGDSENSFSEYFDLRALLRYLHYGAGPLRSTDWKSFLKCFELVFCQTLLFLVKSGIINWFYLVVWGNTCSLPWCIFSKIEIPWKRLTGKFDIL